MLLIFYYNKLFLKWFETVSFSTIGDDVPRSDNFGLEQGSNEFNYSISELGFFR